MGLVAVAVAFALAAPAMAVPQALWQVPETGPASGSGAGEVRSPTGIVSDSNTGNVLVVDTGNSRIDEFTPWGEFVKAFGWDVNASAPANELQVCTPATGCQSGTRGGGPGQINSATGIAMTPAGTILVAEEEGYRFQAFDREGHFLFTVGGQVNKTKVEAASSEAQQNMCPVDPGDVCQTGIAGTGPSEFSSPEPYYRSGDRIAVGPGEAIYVGDTNRIQVFAADGDFTREITGDVTGKTVIGLEVDGSGNSYVSYEGFQGEEGIQKLGPAGEKLLTFSTGKPGASFPALALGSQGELFAVSDRGFRSLFGSVPSEPRIVEFDPLGAKIIPDEEEEKAEEAEPPVAPFPFGQVPSSTGELMLGLTTNSACGLTSPDVIATYAGDAKPESLLRAYGPTPDRSACPPPERPPTITTQFTSSVSASQASVKAAINSHFWSTTSYYVEYGLNKCSEGGCTEKLPVPPSGLGSASNLSVPTNAVVLPGLTPETIYYYRFVAATNFEGGSGQTVEVKGVGGVPGSDGSEATFTTREETLPPRADCQNQSLRGGMSAHLANCRAYEMVSPGSKEGADVVAVNSLVTEQPARLDQSAVSGDALTYSAYRAFANPLAAPLSSQFLSRRGENGWSTESISPGRGESLESAIEPGDVEFQAFSDDLCQSWLRLMFVAEPQLDPNELTGFPNEFRRSNCSPELGSYQALTTIEPPDMTDPTRVHFFNPNLLGVSADGRCAVFRAPDRLTPEAPLLPKFDEENILYENCAGTLRLLAILPDGTPVHASSIAGTGNQAEALPQNVQRSNTAYRAVSRDGTSIYWTSPGEKPGKLYLRIHADQPQSPIVGGKCSEPTMGCTLPVSELLSGGSARFWTASADGTRAIVSANGLLYQYSAADPANPKVTVIASGIDETAGAAMGVLGASEDASRIYFASKSVLAAGASAGKPNLYFLEIGEAPRFIGTLVPSDLDGGVLVESTAISPRPNFRAARVSPDGLHAAFMSSGRLTGFDNTDQVNGEPDREVFVYDAAAEEGAGRLVCVSCDPSGGRPTGSNIANNEQSPPVWAAARIPTWQSSLYPSNALVTEGPAVRLFFDSFVPLVGSDTNERADVYEWESAADRAACEQAGAERYVASMAGCLSLISSGQSNQDSEFIDASPAGRDVFFATGQSLLPQDPSSIDIYDAREGGGFSEPVAPQPCEGEACQHPGSPLGLPSSGSGAKQAGNPKSPKGCPKGQRRVKRKGGRTACVKKKHQKHKHGSKPKSRGRDASGQGGSHR